MWVCFNPYFTGLPILISTNCIYSVIDIVSILILLDYLFLYKRTLMFACSISYVSILILLDYLFLFSIYWIKTGCYLCFNPYFTGLPILISIYNMEDIRRIRFQSLFYWITYSYNLLTVNLNLCGFVSILILLDYLFL